MGCLDDLDAHALVAGTLVPERLPAALAHVERCADCRELIAGLCAGSPDSPHGDARIGEIAGGAYRIDALLADGGMGSVYRATDLAGGGAVAIKVPRSRARALRRRFEREIAISVRLAHPAIVAVRGTGALADGTPYLAMQLATGGSLELALYRATTCAERLALVPHVRAVADAMAFAHAHAIIHRDLKPRNVMFGPAGEIVIIDWGLAKHLGDAPPLAPPPTLARPAAVIGSAAAEATRVLGGRTTHPGDVMGTPAFMAPEQARGEAVDRRCDVYAIGAMLRCVLVGSLRGHAATAALEQAPAELAAICRRATADLRERRHRDAGELAGELAAVLDRPRRRRRGWR